jgi:hypothetical protein
MTKEKQHIEKPMRFNARMYSVNMTIWEGSGSGKTIALCRSLQDAAMVVQGLKAILPSRLDSECGDSKINRKVSIEIHPCHTHEVKEFVEEQGW